MREKIIAKFSVNNMELVKNTKKISKMIDGIRQKSLENLQELQKIAGSLNEERSFLEEEQRLIEEFQRNMKTLQRKGSKYTDNIGDNVKCLKNNQHEIIDMSESSKIFNIEFLSHRENDYKNNCSLVENSTSEIELCADQSVVKCTTINMQIENMVQESLKKAEQISNKQTEYQKDLIDISKHYKNECKRLRIENYSNIKENTERISLSLDDRAKCLKDNLNTLKNSNSSVKKSLIEYTQLYRKQMTQCVNDLESFRCSELKTYTVIRAISSKKEFSYPKVLAETSPHTRIVKRFQLESGWSDLDTTVAIDEESEGEVEYAIVSTHNNDPYNVKAILNSTPK